MPTNLLKKLVETPGSDIPICPCFDERRQKNGRTAVKRCPKNLFYHQTPAYMKSIAVFLFLLLALSSLAQVNLPKDYLTPTFHAGRREALRALMPPRSVAVIFAYPVRNFSNDVEFPYHPNPDLYYFSGYKEPNAVLFIFKEPQHAPDGSTYKELFFIQHRDPEQEL